MAEVLEQILRGTRGLTTREYEVATLVIKGLSNKAIASELFVTEKTVKFHLTSIYRKMHVKSRTQLIVWAMPHMSFEASPLEPKPESKIEPNSDNIPVGINKVGNA